MNKIKIAIIGAGASGFGAAEAFRSKEYESHISFTIYEKDNFVGGKCRTVLPDGSIANGQADSLEVGATLIPKHSPSYAELNKLIEKYDIKLTPFREANRRTSLYMRKGKPIAHEHPFGKPGVFFNAIHDYEEYVADYLKYSLFKPVSYSQRPKFLNRNLSKVYGKAVNDKFVGMMQGFGYADLDDRHLTPPLLYYHQYIEPEAIEFPIYKVDNGTQSIWLTVAKSYPKNTIRLNEQVLHIERHPDLVRVRTDKSTEDFDYLIVATPLKPAIKFLDFTSLEKQFLQKMKYNHYVSVICQASGQSTISRFNLSACLNRKRIGDVVLTYQRHPNSNHIVAYLYLKEGYLNDDASILSLVEESLDKDLGLKMVNKKSFKIYHWEDYFGHLDTKTLNSGWYDAFDKNYQGKRRTVFVGGGLHMETMGAAFQYGTRLAKQYADIWAR